MTTSRKILRFADLWDRGVLYGRKQIDRLEADGRFPKRVTIGARRVGWVAAEIDEWINTAILSR